MLIGIILIMLFLVSCTFFEYNIVNSSFEGELIDITYPVINRNIKNITFDINRDFYRSSVSRESYLNVYIDGVVYEEVEIPIETFYEKPKDVLIELLDKKGNIITKTELVNFMILNVMGQEIINSTEKYLNAESVYLFNTENLKKIDSLNSLKNLEKIFLENCCKVDSYSSLADLDALEELYIKFIEGNDSVKTIGDLHNLKILKIWGIKGFDEIDFLEKMHNLEILFIGGYEGESVEIVKNLTLKALYFQGCDNIRNISDLEEMSNINIIFESY